MRAASRTAGGSGSGAAGCTAAADPAAHSAATSEAGFAARGCCTVSLQVREVKQLSFSRPRPSFRIHPGGRGTFKRNDLPMKLITTLLMMGAVMIQPTIAAETQVMPEMPWPAQLGVIGLLGMLLFWESRRRSDDMDRMLKVHRETVLDINSDIKEQTSEMRAMRESTQSLCTTLASRPCLIKDSE